MNTETLTALVTEWRAAATLSDDASKPEGNYILEAMASGSRDAFTECADHLESAIAATPSPPAPSEGGNLGEYVIALLIAGGFVTQAKCDEARAIALGITDGPLAAPAVEPVACWLCGGDAKVRIADCTAHPAAAPSEPDVSEAMILAAEEIERCHEWITAVGASAIIRKHAAALRSRP